MEEAAASSFLLFAGVASFASVILVPLVVLCFYFIYQFITMNTTPFKAMQAIYVYVAALIGLALVAFGLYGIVEHLLDVLLTPAAEFAQDGVSFNSGLLVTPLTQIITGLFVMVPHWAVGHHFHLKESKK